MHETFLCSTESRQVVRTTEPCIHWQPTVEWPRKGPSHSSQRSCRSKEMVEFYFNVLIPSCRYYGAVFFLNLRDRMLSQLHIQEMHLFLYTVALLPSWDGSTLPPPTLRNSCWSLSIHSNALPFCHRNASPFIWITFCIKVSHPIDFA